MKPAEFEVIDKELLICGGCAALEKNKGNLREFNAIRHKKMGEIIN